MAGDEYSCELPVLEEFIPLKSSAYSSVSDKSHKATSDSMPDWLRPAQLYAPSIAAESSPVNSSKLRKPVAKVGGAFELFEKEKPCSPIAAEILESSITRENISAHRKQMRCWSPELHRSFLCALERLGGSQSATPKQIRELMKVERLTNDETRGIHHMKEKIKKGKTQIKWSPPLHGWVKWSIMLRSSNNSYVIVLLLDTVIIEVSSRSIFSWFMGISEPLADGYNYLFQSICCF